MIPYILLGLAAVVLLVVVVVQLQPADFRITRSALIGSTPAMVFAQVNDFHRWEAWSPWAKMDPNARVEFAGPDSGVGAAFTWSGNNQVGEGSNCIVESRPPELIRIRLEFVRPFKATNVAEFSFLAEGGGTRVTWTMTGKNNFMGKAVGLIINCDRMVGGQFETGLGNLRRVVEGGPTA